MKQIGYLSVFIFMLFVFACGLYAQSEITDDMIADDTATDDDITDDLEADDTEEEAPLEDEAVEETMDDDTEDKDPELLQTQTMPQTHETLFLNFSEAWMLAPMRTGHKNGIYSIAGFGRMESARIQDAEGIQAGFNFLMAGFGGGEDNDPDYDGTLSLLELEGRYGIIDDFEAGLRLLIGGWEGTLEVPGLPLNSETGTTLGDIFVHAKYRFMGDGAVVDLDTPLAFDVAGLLTLKLPTGSQEDVMGSGGFDISLNVLASIFLMENAAINVMIGFTSAGDGDEVQPQEEHTWGFLFNFGIGGVYKINEMISVVLQTEFYDPVMDLTLGVKAFFEVAGIKMFPELGFTYGLYTQAADYTILLSLTMFI